MDLSMLCSALPKIDLEFRASVIQGCNKLEKADNETSRKEAAEALEGLFKTRPFESLHCCDYTLYDNAAEAMTKAKHVPSEEFTHEHVKVTAYFKEVQRVIAERKE